MLNLGGIRSYLFDRRDAFVVRWHARQTARTETLAEHHYFVTRDAELIARALHYYGIAEPSISDVVMMAMVHDEPEKETGDISGEAKRLYPELKKVLEKIEAGVIEKLLFNGLPEVLGDYYRNLAMRITQPETDDLEAQIVKYADKLEAYLFAYTEVQQGNSLMQEVVFVVQQELDTLTWDWLTSLRRETGLP